MFNKLSYQNMIYEESRFKLRSIGVTRIELDDSYIEIPTFYDVIKGGEIVILILVSGKNNKKNYKIKAIYTINNK